MVLSRNAAAGKADDGCGDEGRYTQRRLPSYADRRVAVSGS
jgi:hypothetical protein